MLVMLIPRYLKLITCSILLLFAASLHLLGFLLTCKWMRQLMGAVSSSSAVTHKENGETSNLPIVKKNTCHENYNKVSNRMNNNEDETARTRIRKPDHWELQHGK